MKTNTLIVGVDFKDNNVQLCNEAVLYARKLNASITLVHAVEYIPYYPYVPYDEDAVNQFHEEDLSKKLDHLESLIKKHDVAVLPSVVRKGKTYEILSKYADEVEAGAIVLGVGRHYLFEELIGSTTEKVSRIARQKLIIVNYTKQEEVKGILCAYDFSENSKAALASAVRFAHFFKAELNVLHVHNSSESEDKISGYLKEDTEKIVNEELTKLNSGESINFKTKVSEGMPVIEILNAVKYSDVQLLSIGSSGHGQLSRFFLGSTVSKIIRKTPCSVVISPKTIN